MAMPQHWFPDNLYNRAISVLVTNYSTYKNDFKDLPHNVQFDIYYKVCIYSVQYGFDYLVTWGCLVASDLVPSQANTGCPPSQT